MEFTAEMIAGLLGGSVVGDKNAAVHTVSSIEGGKKGALTYLSNPKYEQYVYSTEASIVLVSNDFEPAAPVSATLIKLPDVGAAVLKLLEMYNAMKPQKSGISPRASISEKATVAEDCYVGDFAVIDSGVKMGANCRIYPHEIDSLRKAGASPVDFRSRFLLDINGENIYCRLESIENYEPVTFWQAEASKDAINITPAIIETDSTDPAYGTQIQGSAVAEDHIIAVLFDRDAVFGELQLERADSTPLEARKHYRNVWNTFAKNGVSDPTENFIVFYMS